MSKTIKTKSQPKLPIFNPPKEGDKYTLETDTAYEYLSIHEHDGVLWQVTAVMSSGNGYIMEFTRRQA
jgi:hypothetical protein